MIYSHFQSTRAYDAGQGLSDLFNICLRNDDVQDFDTRWDQILLGTSDMPRENVLKGLYKNKLQGSERLQTVFSNSVCKVQARIESRSGGTETH